MQKHNSAKHIILLALHLVLLVGIFSSVEANTTVEITIIYAPESELYMPQVIESFNASYTNGLDPITGAPLAPDAVPIHITGEVESSGVMMEEIVRAFIDTDNPDLRRPTIFQPSVSHWLRLVNFYSGQSIFDLERTSPTANAPVVIAIWESRLQAIRNTLGYDEIGWEELLGVLQSANGWQDYGVSGNRSQVFYGHTDPFISSTGLSTLISEFYASARINGFDGVLTPMTINDPDVQQGVRDIQLLVRHYSNRTTEFKNYIAQGPDYIDFVALEENDLLAINRGLTEFTPPERLIALYPKEGTFMHEHPMGIVNANWTSDEQRTAANVFIRFILQPQQQRLIAEQGFRPVNQSVSLDAMFFDPTNGVDPAGPSLLLPWPDEDILASIQQSWALVQKDSDILLLMDISGSMEEDNKLSLAQQGVLSFLVGVDADERVGLITFNDQVVIELVPDFLEVIGNQLSERIQQLRADGNTALFQAIEQGMNTMQDLGGDGRIRIIILLSDGENTEPGVSLGSLRPRIEAISDSRDPILIIPIAYGSNADFITLTEIARASNTQLIPARPDNIVGLLQQLSSYVSASDAPDFSN